jgi:hypothetical protein
MVDSYPAVVAICVYGLANASRSTYAVGRSEKACPQQQDSEVQRFVPPRVG